jgi:Tol biopolymer transport system component
MMRKSWTLLVVLGIVSGLLPALGLWLPGHVRASEWRQPFDSLLPGADCAMRGGALGGPRWAEQALSGPRAAEQALSGPRAAIPPASNFILYTRSDSTCWLKDTTGDRQIIANCQYPRLSPDGRYIVYRRGDIHNGDLYVRDLETDVDTLALANDDYIDSFSWTPDGSKIVFDYACGIYAVDRDGTNEQQLVGAWPAFGYCLNDAPDCNPVDGRLTWLNWNYAIGAADADGQNPYWVPNTAVDDVYPAWSPDGQWIAFLRDYINLYKIRPDGSSLVQLSFLADPDAVIDTGYAWTADGNWVVAAVEVSEVKRLYAIAADGSGRTMALNTQAGADPIQVGSAGILVSHRVYLPLLVKQP